MPTELTEAAPLIRFVVYSRSFDSRPRALGQCRVCGQPGDNWDVRHGCDENHASRARKKRKAGEPLFAGPDVCRHCGAWTPPRPRARLCGRPECRAAWKSGRGFKNFEQRVEEMHELGWLAASLRVSADDPRLPAIALKLAEAGKLVVYVRADGTVGEIGKPRDWLLDLEARKPRKREEAG